MHSTFIPALRCAMMGALLALAACTPDKPAIVAAAPAASAAVATAAAAPPPPTVAELEAAAPKNPLRDAYFGELHLHTAYSMDAYIFGNTMNDPFTAYRFAKGEVVKLPNGVDKRIQAPLDFAAVTDHAEALGEYEICTNPKMANYESETCKGVRAQD